MKVEQFKSIWDKVKGKLKENYSNLSDNDLVYNEGKLDEMLGRIQHKTGKTKEALRDEINSHYSKYII